SPFSRSRSCQRKAKISPTRKPVRTASKIMVRTGSRKCVSRRVTCSGISTRFSRVEIFSGSSTPGRVFSGEVPPFLGIGKDLRHQIAQVIATFPAQSVVEFLQNKTLQIDG